MMGDEDHYCRLKLIHPAETADRFELVSDKKLFASFLSLCLLDPSVSKGLLGTDAVGWLISQHLLHQIFGMRANTIPVLWREGNLSFENELVYVVISRTNERRPSSEHNVEDYSQRPNVTLLIILLLNDFRSHVIDASNLESTIAFRERSPYTEVDNLQTFLLLAQKHDIFRLKVSVHDVMTVAVLDCRE